MVKLLMFSLQNSKRSLFIFISFVVFICFNIYCHCNNRNVTCEPNFNMDLSPADVLRNNISCHYVDDNDTLLSAEDRKLSVEPNSLFFLETSCKGGLNSRQACAIESASRAHPNNQVYVMFSGPITDVVYSGSYFKILRQFPNIKFARIHITNYVKNTPLETMLAGEPFKQSKWRVEHTSDFLRFLTLYKWGGVYLDTDMLIVKPLTPLGPNWVAREDENYVNAAAIAISKDAIGRKLAEAVINELKTTYRPDVFAHNGPGAITRVLQKMCGTPKLTDWSPKTCQGLEVYGPEYFYPIYYPNNDVYFKTGVLKNLSDKTYGHHIWNAVTRDKEIERGSPYAMLAQEFCPTIHDGFKEEFGAS